MDYEIGSGGRDDDWVNIGHEHAISLRWVEIKQHGESRLIMGGLLDRHAGCARGIDGWIPFANAEEPLGPDPHGWTVENWDPEHLTLSPSLLCMTCGDHGYIRDGAWVAV